jgi:hypothetical protein
MAFANFEEKYSFGLEVFFYASLYGGSLLEHKLRDPRYVESIVKPAGMLNTYHSALENPWDKEKDFYSEAMVRLIIGSLKYLYHGCDWGEKAKPATFKEFYRQKKEEGTRQYGGWLRRDWGLFVPGLS